MIGLDRRAFLALLAATALPPGASAQRAAVTDATGRGIAVPARVERVFPAGPPAAVLLYTLAPDLLVGWPRANSPEARTFLLPGVGGRPEVGILTGRGGTANLETVLQLKPDLILDAGSTDATYVSLAERVQAQTGIPYALLDGRLDRTAETYHVLGRLVGREARAEEFAATAEATLGTVLARVAEVPGDERPRTYYARGPEGLETALAGSINVEAVELWARGTSRPASAAGSPPCRWNRCSPGTRR